MKHLIHLMKCCDKKNPVVNLCVDYIDHAVVIDPVSIHIPQKRKLINVACIALY